MCCDCEEDNENGFMDGGGAAAVAEHLQNFSDAPFLIREAV
jgi:hypothetical protein